MPPQNRLARPLTNSLAYSVPVPLEPGMMRPAPAAFNPRRELENLSIGLGRGAVTGMEGTKQLLTQPVATAQALIEAARQLGTDPAVILDMLRAARQKAMSGSLGLGELLGENVTPGMRGRGAPVARITEPERALSDLWHGSGNPAFERFDPAIKGTYARMPALGPGHYIGEKGYAEGFVGPQGSLTKWKPNIKKSLYFDDEGFTPNTPRANAANRKAFEAVKKVDPELAYKVFKFDKGRIVAIHLRELKQSPEGKPFLDYSAGQRAMDIAGIDSVVDADQRGVAQVMVRDPANLQRVE